jgi:hypothetical protein
MNRLTFEQFQRARKFLKEEARPLDRAAFEHRFEGAPANRVVEALSAYQNAGGGFGRALEPDLRTPSSSALCTGIALELLSELDRESTHPLVAGAVDFLLETFDEDRRLWRVIPDDANDYPHAPWWHDEDGSLARTFDNFLVIPRAKIVGLLHHYRKLVPNDWLTDVTEETASAVETLNEEAFAGGGDALRYALNLAEEPALPQRFRDRLIPRLQDLTPEIVCREPDEWSGYCATPLKIAPSPDSAMADMLWDDLQQHLDYTIDRQTGEGTWEPTWTWGDFYPQVWERAKLEWRGHVTLETLTTLRAFGRIDT